MYIQRSRSYHYKSNLFHTTSSYAHHQPSPCVRIRTYTHPSPSHPKHIGATRGTHTDTRPRCNLPKLPNRRDMQHQPSNTCIDLCRPPTRDRSVPLPSSSRHDGGSAMPVFTPDHHRGEGTWYGVGAQTDHHGTRGRSTFCSHRQMGPQAMGGE